MRKQGSGRRTQEANEKSGQKAKEDKFSCGHKVGEDAKNEEIYTSDREGKESRELYTDRTEEQKTDRPLMAGRETSGFETSRSNHQELKIKNRNKSGPDSYTKKLSMQDRTESPIRSDDGRKSPPKRQLTAEENGSLDMMGHKLGSRSPPDNIKKTVAFQMKSATSFISNSSLRGKSEENTHEKRRNAHKGKHELMHQLSMMSEKD